MSEKQARKKGQPPAARSRGKRSVVVITLALVCVVGTSLLAQVNSQKKGKRASGEVSTMSLSAASPSKEYIYAGAKLVSTVEPTSVNGNDAQFVSMTLDPQAFGDDQYHLVTVTMWNSGTTTWSSGTGYALGSQNPANNTRWGQSRVALPFSVPPGTSVTFSFSAAKLYNPGSGYISFQWQMVQDGGAGFFGEMTRNQLIQAGAWLPLSSPNNASFVSQTTPSFMLAGQSYSVSITMQNTGTNTWTAAGNYKLGSQFPQDNTYWGTNRVVVPSSVSPGANVTFNFNVTAPATPGVYNFQWMMVQDGGAGWFGNLSPPVFVAVNKKAALGYLDYNNDGKTDIATWRPTDRNWRLDYNLDGVADVTQQFFTLSNDTPIPSDYNGDGQADFAQFRRLFNSTFFFIDFNRDGTNDYTWGPGSSSAIIVPVPGDYNGDGQTDPAFFNKSTNNWSMDCNHDGVTDSTVITFGASGDIPVPADYNRDGRTDIAVFRRSTGQWFIDTDLNGVADITISFGQNGDIPLPMDYNGDGIADIAVFRPSTGQWFIDTNLDGIADLTITFGVSGDIPVPGDYNGDGKVDIAFFRPSTAQWFIDTNKDGVADITVAFGQGNDIPLRQNGWILRTMGILPQ